MLDSLKNIPESILEKLFLARISKTNGSYFSMVQWLADNLY